MFCRSGHQASLARVVCVAWSHVHGSGHPSRILVETPVQHLCRLDLLCGSQCASGARATARPQAARWPRQRRESSAQPLPATDAPHNSLEVAQSLELVLLPCRPVATIQMHQLVPHAIVSSRAGASPSMACGPVRPAQLPYIDACFLHSRQRLSVAPCPLPRCCHTNPDPITALVPIQHVVLQTMAPAATPPPAAACSTPPPPSAA